MPGLSVDRTDVDDPAPATFAHAGEAGLGHVEAAAKIDAHHFVPVFPAHLVKHPIAGDPGIIDHDVDRTDILFDLRASRDGRVVIAHVPFVGGYSGLVGEGARLGIVAAKIGDNPAALLLECKANRLANSAGTTGDDCYACHQLFSHSGPWRPFQFDPRLSAACGART